MGEEYGEEAPFLYFVSHTDPDLVKAVREGRKKEFSAFHLEGEYKDPESHDTFHESQLKWNWQEGKQKVMREFYQHLIQLRQSIPALKNLDRKNLEASAIEQDKLLFLHRWNAKSKIFCIMNFNDKDVNFKPTLPNGNWQKILDTSESKWMGSGPTMPDKLIAEQLLTIRPQSFALYQQ